MANEVVSSPAAADVIAYRSSIVDTMRDAIKLPSRNVKLMIKTVLLMFSSLSLLVLLHSVVAGTLVAKVEDGYESSAVDPNDLRAFVGIESFFVVSYFFVSFLGMILAVYYSAIVYNGRSMCLKDLFSKIRSTWKKPFVTWSLVSLLTVLYLALVLTITTELVQASYLYVWSWMVGILAAGLYLYLAAFCNLGLVVSVLEEECPGTKALWRAGKLMKGKARVAFGLMSLLEMSSVPVYIFFFVTSADDDDELGVVGQFAFGAASTLLFCLAKFFAFVVFTVFYYECRQNHGEKIDLELGEGYKLVPTAT